MKVVYIFIIFLSISYKSFCQKNNLKTALDSIFYFEDQYNSIVWPKKRALSPPTLLQSFLAKNNFHDTINYSISDQESKDIIALAAVEENKKRKEEIKEFGVEDFFDSLLFSRNYSENGSRISISNYLLSLVQSSLNDMKLILTKREFFKIKEFKISDNEKNTNILWLNTDIDNNTIYISPYIVRAAFITCYNDVRPNFQNIISYFENKKYLDRETLLGSKWTKADLSDLNSNFVQKFKSGFYFILSHELAHGYLGIRSHDLLTEEKCDSAALSNLFHKHISYQYDLFEKLIKSSIDENESYLWGITDIDQLNTRLGFINIIKNGHF